MFPDERFRVRFEEIRYELLKAAEEQKNSLIYYRRHWDECRADQYSSWGTCDFYFEAAPDGTVIRQMEVYENGTVLQYHPNKIEDPFGGLTDQLLEPLEEYSPFTISREEFERIWNAQAPN